MASVRPPDQISVTGKESKELFRRSLQILLFSYKEDEKTNQVGEEYLCNFCQKRKILVIISLYFYQKENGRRIMIGETL